MKTVANQKKVTLEELLVFSLATADALVELLIENAEGVRVHAQALGGA